MPSPVAIQEGPVAFSTALCLRLPLIFIAAGKPLLTAATAADESLARKAVLLPHWLCAAGTADAPTDA